MTLPTISAATMWLFASINSVVGAPQPIIGGYGPQFFTRAECVSRLPTYGNWLTCVRVP